MGIEYQAAIFYGVPRKELIETAGCTLCELDEIIGNGVLDQCSPYYDADVEDCLFGYFLARTPDYNYRQIDLSKIRVEDEAAEFEALLGIKGRVYLSPYGS